MAGKVNGIREDLKEFLVNPLKISDNFVFYI